MTEKNLNPKDFDIQSGILSSDSPIFSKLKSFSDKYNRQNSITFNNRFFDWQYKQAFDLFPLKDNGFYFCKNSVGNIIGYCSASNAPYLWNGKKITGRFFHEWYSNPTQSGSTTALLARQLELSPIFQVMGASIQNINVLLRMRDSIWFPLRRVYVVLDSKNASLLLQNKRKDACYLLDALQLRIPKSTEHPAGKHITRFGDAYQKTWTRISKHFTAAVDKSSKYMNWRYVDHPIFSYSRHVYTSSRGKSVYIIWRAEYVREKQITVARICEIIGASVDLPEIIPSFFQNLIDADIVFADFFCTNNTINSVLKTTGFYEAIPLIELDIPRLFSPLQDDFRKTLHSVISVSKEYFSTPAQNTSECYFTKGDVNQDMPNV